jgi:hypothetical protein
MAAVTGDGLLLGANQRQSDDREEHRNSKYYQTIHVRPPLTELQGT